MWITGAPDRINQTELPAGAIKSPVFSVFHVNVTQAISCDTLTKYVQLVWPAIRIDGLVATPVQPRRDSVGCLSG
jgi:hypothetical protein